MNCNEFMSFLLHTWKDKLSDSLVGRAGAKKTRGKYTLASFCNIIQGKIINQQRAGAEWRGEGEKSGRVPFYVAPSRKFPFFAFK